MSDFTGPGQEDSIHARDVRPGMVVWNPYGGARGQAVVASQPRERPDGAIEFDTTDGRTGVYRPHFRLHFDRTATQRLAAQRDAERQSQAGRPPEADPERIETGVTSDGRDAQAIQRAQQELRSQRPADPELEAR